MTPDEAYRQNYRLIDWSVPIPSPPRREHHIARSHLPCPYIVGDGIEVKSMVDGKIYTSKAALRRSYREKGYIEVGNEEQKMPPKPKPDRRAIRESIERAFSQTGIAT